MEVPELALSRQFETIAGEIQTAFAEVFAAQRFASGPKVAELEEKLAAYCQAQHAVGVASGTDALLVALLALGIGPGDEVITTPFTFFATAGAIHRVGARPVFADIRPDTCNIDPPLVADAVTHRTRAILPVHLYGQTADMEPLVALAASRGLRLIEDAAQAVGAAYEGRRAGSFGDAACLSFYPTKNLAACGEAGMVLCEDSAVAEQARLLRNHGMDRQYHHDIVGFNSRMDELQAAALLVKLRHLDSWSRARRERAARYGELLADVAEVAPLSVGPHCEHVFHQYVVRAQCRDGLLEHLRARGVGTRVFYPVPLHLQPCFAQLGYVEGDFPEAERAAREVLTLPVYPELSTEEQEYVAEAVAEFYRSS